MRRTLLSLTLCALPTAAAIALLSSRRAARDREEDALGEVARSERRLARMIAAAADLAAEVDRCTQELDEALTMSNINAKFLTIANRRRAQELISEADISEARATADACYETGWMAIVERDGWDALAQSNCRKKHELEHELRDMVGRVKCVESHCKDAIARAEAAEKARDESVARVAALEEALADVTQRAALYAIDALEAPVEPAAVAPVATPKCIMCGVTTAHIVYENDDEDSFSKIPCCHNCYDKHGVVAIRARHAARTASATPVACPDGEACPDAEFHAAPAEKVYVKAGDEFRRAQGASIGRITHVTEVGRDGEAYLAGWGWWPIDRILDPGQWTRVDPAAAPTQDDLDDAAVRLKLADGPLHWMSVVKEWDRGKGDVLTRFMASQRRLQLVRSEVGGVELWALPAAEPAKDPS